MREVKFRVWDEERKKIFQVIGLLFGLTKVQIQVLPDTTTLIDIPTNGLLQYTGLKDKNGREIYVGDILKVEHPVNDIMSGLFAVEINPDSMNYVVGAWSLGAGVYQFGEVIGNIYENQKLLEN